MKNISFLLLFTIGSICGFAQWSKILTLRSSEYFGAIGASSDENVWVVARKIQSTKLFIYNTSNGGNTWEKTEAHGLVSNIWQTYITQVYPLDKATAFLCVNFAFGNGTDTGYVYKTADGGANWSAVFSSLRTSDIKMGMFDKHSGLMHCNFISSAGFILYKRWR